MNFPVTHYELMMKTNIDTMTTEIVNDLYKFFGNKELDFLDFGDKLLKRYPEYMGMHSVIGGSSQITFAACMLYHIWRMKANKEKIYYFSRQLCNMLIATRVNIDFSFINPPFEEFFLAIDQDEIMITDGGRISTGKTLPVKGMYINFRKDNDGIRKLRVLATANNSEQDEDINYQFNWSIRDTGNVEEIMETNIDSLLKGNIINLDDNLKNLENIKSIYKFVINCILYLTSKDADLFPFRPDRHLITTKNPKKLKKQIQASKNTVEYPYVRVGFNLSYDTDPSVNQGGRITIQFSVKGHWREQWYGSEKDNTRIQKPIWIMPFVKGKDFADGIHKKMLVEEPVIKSENMV